MLDYIIGSEQSRYAGIAMLVSVVFICIAILFTEATIGSKLFAVFLIVLVSIVPVCLSLFQLTCIVTGGKNTSYNMCNIYAWIVTAFIVLYCLMLVVSVISSIFVYKKALTNVTAAEKSVKFSKEDQDKIAKNILEDMQIQESFYQQEVMPEMPAMPVDHIEHVELVQPKKQHDTEYDESHVEGFAGSDGYASLDSFENSIIVEAPTKTRERQPMGKEPEPFSTDDNLAPL